MGTEAAVGMSYSGMSYPVPDQLPPKTTCQNSLQGNDIVGGTIFVVSIIMGFCPGLSTAIGLSLATRQTGLSFGKPARNKVISCG